LKNRLDVNQQGHGADPAARRKGTDVPPLPRALLASAAGADFARLALRRPETSVEMPTFSASTYASSVDITWPPVTYQLAPAISASGRSGNNPPRTKGRRGELGAVLLAGSSCDVTPNVRAAGAIGGTSGASSRTAGAEGCLAARAIAGIVTSSGAR
jgi:hypothetical protein